MSELDPIRVLCVFSTLDRGGAESMCMNLYRHIDRNKVQFDFIKHTSEHGAYEDEITDLGGRIYEAPRLKPMHIGHYLKWWSAHLDCHPEHRIIHGHFFSISAVYFWVAKRKNRLTIGHIHASSPDGWLKACLESRISSQADIALACSQEAGRWIYGNRPFTVLHNALDTNEYCYDADVRAEVRRKLNVDSKLVLGTVANLSGVKNPMGLLDIFIAVKTRRPEAQLLWVGEGSMRELIETRIEREGLDTSVKLLGSRDDVSRLLQAMDVFLLPSYSEGLPMSLIEAQAAGLTCFVSDAVTREADITNLCRFLSIEQPKLWANAILTQLAERKDTSAMIAAAGYDVRFTAQLMQERYLALNNCAQ